VAGLVGVMWWWFCGEICGGGSFGEGKGEGGGFDGVLEFCGGLNGDRGEGR